MATQDFYTWACVLAMCPAFAAVLLFFCPNHTNCKCFWNIMYSCNAGKPHWCPWTRKAPIGNASLTFWMLCTELYLVGISRECECVNCEALFNLNFSGSGNIHVRFAPGFSAKSHSGLWGWCYCSCNWLGWTIKPYSCEEFQKLSLFRLHWEPHRLAAIFSD